jgi:hypothetical protein
MNLLDSKHAADLAYEKDTKKYVLIDSRNGKKLDSTDSLDKLKKCVENHHLEYIICYENEDTGLSQEDINKLTKLLLGKKKEKKSCLVLGESDPVASAAVIYDASDIFSY